MNTTQINQGANTASSDSAARDFGSLLKDILDLPRHEQQRLSATLNSMLGDTTDSTATVDPARVQEASALDDEPERVQSYLNEIRQERPNTQIRLIDDLTTQVETQDSLTMLHARRQELLDDSPPLAVRVAITRLASDKPGQLAIGAAGLLLAVVSAGVWVFQRII